MLWFEPGVAVCRVMDADPWATLASGALLAAFPETDVESSLLEFSSDGHPAAVIGRAEVGSGVYDRRGGDIAWSERDEVARLASAGFTHG